MQSQLCRGALGTEGLDEGTAAAINSAIEQLNAGLGNASAAQGELGNIQAQSQVAVQAETNGSSVQESLNAIASTLEGAAGSISEAASASSSTLAGEADKLIAGAAAVESRSPDRKCRSRTAEHRC